MELIQSPIMKKVKRINAFMIICLVIGALFFGCSAGGGGGGGGGGDAPEMDVTLDGAAVPDEAVAYDIGTIQWSGAETLVVNFTIANSGNLDLNLTGNPDKIELTGDAEFTKDESGTGAVLAASTSTTFEITFTPVAEGQCSADISIANDDNDENPYNFSIIAEAIAPASEINVKQDAADILSGTLYDFGNVQVGDSSTVTFIIEDLGLLDLNLTGGPPLVELTGDAQFTLESDASTPVASMGSTTFDIKYSPDAEATHTATVSIANDDADENPYTFTISGDGVVPAPEMNVKQDATDIESGTGSHDFGTVLVGSPENVAFTIENSGMLELNLIGGPPVIELTGDAEFTLDTDASTPVAASGSTTFIITYTPTGAVDNSATVSIANDDSDENPYTFTITGHGQSLAPNINGISSGSYNTDQAFTLSGIDVGSTGYYSLNNGADWIEYTAEVTLSAEGDYQVVAKQIDALLQESDVSSPSIDVTIDKTDPDPPAGLDLAAADDTGDSDTDNITKNAAGLTISGTAEADVDIDLSSDVDGPVGSTTADGSGDWSVDISLSEDVHSITAVATDAANNSSGDSVALGITVDTTPPSTPGRPDLAAADDSNINNDDITYNYQDLTFTGTADAGIEVVLSSDIEGDLDTVNADGGGNYTFDPIDLVNNNTTHSITAKVVDIAGNEASSLALSLTLDTIAPSFRDDKFGLTDLVVVVDASVASNFTTESNITSTWNSGTKQVELKDVAGNTDTRDNVYQGAEADGLRTAVEDDVVNGDVVYMMAGQYDIASELNVGVNMTIKGEGSSSFINQQTASGEAVIYLAVNGLTVYIEGLKLDCLDWNIIRAGFNTVDLYVKNITKGPVTAQYLVTIIGNAYYWVSGSGYVAAQNGVDGWEFALIWWRFMGANDTTCWTE
ncbi:MAG: choice-of-anchor D domain-containing protein [Spirochaetales bacterium]|nr:choice-of-anchor D domain-containing protein [Spirochaetales bacterium]